MLFYGVIIISMLKKFSMIVMNCSGLIFFCSSGMVSSVISIGLVNMMVVIVVSGR